MSSVTKRKVVALLMSVVLAFSMTSATALSAFADELSAGSLGDVLQGQATSKKPAVYESVYGVFGGEYSLMYKTVVFTGEYLGVQNTAVTDTIADVVRADGVVTLHTSSSKSSTIPDKSNYPSNETWSKLQIKTLNGSVATDMEAGYIGVQSKITGKCGVMTLEGSKLIPMSYDDFANIAAGGFVGLIYKKSSVKAVFFDEKAKQCGSVTAKLDGTSSSYTYNSTSSVGKYVVVAGRTANGSYSVAAVKKGGTYTATKTIKSIESRDATGSAFVLKSNGYVYFVNANGKEKKIAAANQETSFYRKGKFICVGDSFYSTTGVKIALDSNYTWSLNDAAGNTALFSRATADGESDQALVNLKGKVLRTFKSRASAYAYALGDDYYSVAVPTGKTNSYKVTIYDSVGTKVKSLGTVGFSALTAYRSYSSDKAVLWYSGYDRSRSSNVLYDTNFKRMTYDSSVYQTGNNGYVLSGSRLTAIFKRPNNGSSAEPKALVVNDSGKSVKIGGYTLGVAFSGTEIYNSLKHGRANMWWATNSKGKWGAIDSKGNVIVPFKFQSYYDSGMDSDYVMVKKSGKWEFFSIPLKDTTSDKISVAKASVSSISSKKYTGKAIKPKPTVKVSGTKLKRGTDYTLSYKNNVQAGTAKLTIAGKGTYSGKRTVAFKISAAANSAKAAKQSVSKTLKATKGKLAKAKALALPTVKTTFGKATWKVTKKDKKGVLSLKAGKLKVKQGAKSGKYIIKVRASVKKTANYKAASTKVVTVKVTIK